MRLFLDLETYCDTPIAAGTHRYAERAEILLFAYAIDDQPAQVIEHPTRTEVRTLVEQADEIVVHNSHFDRTVLRHALGIYLPIEHVADTMVLALAHSLPGGLGQLCNILRVPTDKTKDAEGKKLIHLFCKPRPARSKIARATAHTHPAEWERFAAYARLDVEAMRELYQRLPRWNWSEYERQLWALDQAINDRGVAIDMALVEAAQRAVAETQATLAEDVQERTDGAVQAATQRDALLAYVAEQYGYRLEDLRGATVERLLEDDAIPAEMRELLQVRLSACTTSVAKYDALARATSEDGRLRGTLQFCGASRTGRWAGRLFQPQNLPRPSLKQPEIDAAIDAMKAGAEAMLVDDVMAAASAAIRGCIVAPPGRKLVVADLSNIEGRMLAWLAGERWKIGAFEAFDLGDGPDLYKLAYARAFNRPAEHVTKDERQLGKVMELACGYQGGAGAFNTMGAIYGLTFEEAKAKSLVQAWRKAHEQTTSFWYDVQDAAIHAVRMPGERIRCRRIEIIRSGGWLRLILPSGRSLCYPSPRVEDRKLSYMGINQYTRKWERLSTYGGKLVENITQAAARDVLADGMLRAEAAGYSVVLSVHDELITETPADPHYTVKGLAKIMATQPAWAKGLPLAAAGFETSRYRKD
jgi:DNA polymerase